MEVIGNENHTQKERMRYKIEEIKLMDEIFKIRFENPGTRFQKSFFTKKFNIGSEVYEYVNNQMCEIAERLNLVKLKSFDDGSHQILRFEKIPSQKFINSGGFEKYFNVVTNKILNDSKYVENQRRHLEQELKPWYKKGHILIPIILSVMAFSISVYQLISGKKPELTEKEIQIMIDYSVKNMAFDKKGVDKINQQEIKIDTNKTELNKIPITSPTSKATQP